MGLNVPVMPSGQAVPNRVSQRRKMGHVIAGYLGIVLTPATSPSFLVEQPRSKHPDLT